MIKYFFAGLVISFIMFYVILVNYKKLKFTKKYKIVLFVLGVILFFTSVIMKTIFVSESILQIIVLSIITPIEISIFIYFGIVIVKKDGKKFKNK